MATQPWRYWARRRTKRWGSVEPHGLAGRVHRELGDTDVDGRDAEAGRGDRPDGRAARQIGAHHERLQRHRRPLGREAHDRRAGGVGGVADVGVELEHRAAVQVDPVLGLVALGVVRVGGVGAVGREARRGRQGLQVALAIPPGERRDPLEDRRQDDARRRRSTTRTRSPRGRRGRSRARRGRRRRRRRGPWWPPSTTGGCRARPLLTSSSSRPSRAGGVRSCTITSHPRMLARPVPSSSARNETKPCSSTRPRPHTGARCCCGLSLSPFSLTPRSRWMASCGILSSGRSTSSRRTSGSLVEPIPGSCPARRRGPRGRGRGRATSSTTRRRTPRRRAAGTRPARCRAGA